MSRRGTLNVSVMWPLWRPQRKERSDTLLRVSKVTSTLKSFVFIYLPAYGYWALYAPGVFCLASNVKGIVSNFVVHGSMTYQWPLPRTAIRISKRTPYRTSRLYVLRSHYSHFQDPARFPRVRVGVMVEVDFLIWSEIVYMCVYVHVGEALLAENQCRHACNKKLVLVINWRSNTRLKSMP